MKKRLAWILVILMMIGITTACGTSTTTPSSQATDAKGTEKPKVNEPNTTEDVVDNTFALPIVPPGQSYILTIAKPDIGGVDNTSFSDGLRVWEEVEARTGITIEWEVYPGSQYVTNAQARLAAGQNLPDIIEIPGTVSDAIRYASQGLILPLKGLIDQYAPDIQVLFEESPIIRKGVTAPDGEVYFLSNYLRSSPNGQGMIIRKDWLDQLGMGIPLTIDDWYNAMKAFKETDLNGLGVGSIIPFGGDLKFFYSGFGMISSQGDYFWHDNDGKISFFAMRQEYKDWLEFCNRLYSEGMIDPMYGAGQSQIGELEKQNRVAILTNHTGVAAEKDAMLNGLGFSDTDNVWVFPPQGPDGKIRWGALNECRNTLRQGITKDCKDPSIAIKFLNYVWANPEGTRLSLCGVEGEHYNLVDGKIKFTDDLINNPQYNINQRLRHFGAFNYLDIQTQEFNDARIGGKFKVFLEMIANNPQNVELGMPILIPSADDQGTIVDLSPDIISYIDEMTIKFISGREPISNFDNFIAKLKSMGIDQLTETYQVMYDRYNAN